MEKYKVHMIKERDPTMNVEEFSVVWWMVGNSITISVILSIFSFPDNLLLSPDRNTQLMIARVTMGSVKRGEKYEGYFYLKYF